MCHMNKLYNTQEDIATTIRSKLLEIIPNMRKTQLNILPYIIIGLLQSESVVASDISKVLKNDFSLVQPYSVVKRIKRFYSNNLFDPYDFYDNIIKYVVNNYKKKHPDDRVHIIFDHMFSKDNYTVFMITMRIGKQGIPLWFRCFKGNDSPDAFKEKLLKEGISYVSNLFNSSFDLIFLADRWFNSISLLSHIASLGHTFCIRLKGNIKTLVYDQKEGHLIWKFLSNFKAYKYHSKTFSNILLSDHLFKVNIVIGKKENVKEPWIIVTNGDPKRAIKDYGYRFGGIECVFKNQKSNGFNLEKTVNASLKYFTTEYTLACFGVLYLMILGAEYSKNSKCYRKLNLETHKYIKGLKTRMLSLFNTGLSLFKIAFNSSRYIRLPFHLILYDI